MKIANRRCYRNSPVALAAPALVHGVIPINGPSAKRSSRRAARAVSSPAVDKQHILAEIRRTAAENEGVPLGVRAFKAETGIKEFDWRGRYWARWSDAVREAGLAPNPRNPKLDETALLRPLATYMRELGRYPTVAEMRLRKRQVPAFPNHKVLERMGSREEMLARLAAFCERTGDWPEVVALCATLATETAEPEPGSGREQMGYVYLALMKVGREKRYKIGKANIVEQRARQVAVNLPEELELVHAISTDDPYGIEGYWHRRFADKRRGGEWFQLTADDVRAFKRRKFQ